MLTLIEFIKKQELAEREELLSDEDQAIQFSPIQEVYYLYLNNGKRPVKDGSK